MLQTFYIEISTLEETLKLRGVIDFVSYEKNPYNVNTPTHSRYMETWRYWENLDNINILKYERTFIKKGTHLFEVYISEGQFCKSSIFHKEIFYICRNVGIQRSLQNISHVYGNSIML